MKLGYSAIFWQEPDLERCLAELAAAGWEGWECRLPLDWLGPPARVRRVCADAGMPLAVYTACGNPEDRSWSNTEANRRRIEFAAEMEADCFMFMTGPKPTGRAVHRRRPARRRGGGRRVGGVAARRCGVELSYHIHTNTLVDSMADWRAYLGMLQRAQLCIDVSHAQLWGADPAATLREFAPQAELRPPAGLQLHLARPRRHLSARCVVRRRRRRGGRLSGSHGGAGGDRIPALGHRLPAARRRAPGRSAPQPHHARLPAPPRVLSCAPTRADTCLICEPGG